MSILNILFALFSSLIYSLLFYQVKELSKDHDWAITAGVSCLIAATLILNHIKDKISEKDPASKLYKVTTELNKLKTSAANEASTIKVKHDRDLAELQKKIDLLNKNISLKDTMIFGIKNGITLNMAVHGQGQDFFDYIKNFVVELSSDLEINTLTPTSTPQSTKWLNMLNAKPSSPKTGA